jgi:hypothetical protein
MVAENASCTTDSISCCCNNLAAEGLALAHWWAVNIEWVVCGYIRGYLWTDGVKDGRVSDSNENITKEQGIEVLLPEVKCR